MVKKFLLYNATLLLSALLEYLFIVVKIDWLTKHSVNELLSKRTREAPTANVLSYFGIICPHL